jgi:hypothetical protein
MKNKIYYYGLICCILVLAGGLLKIFHLPGAGIALTLGITFFCLWFIPLSLLSSYKAEKDKKVKWLYIIGFITVLVDLGGALFKIQHWPGAEISMIVGIPVSFILFLPAYLLYNRTDSQVNYRNLLPIMFFFAYYAVITALLSLNVSKNIIDASVVAAYNLNEKSQITNVQCNLINYKPEGNAIATDIKAKADNLCLMIDSLTREIAISTDENHHMQTSVNAINLWEIKGKDINSAGNFWFVYSDNGKLLKKEIKQFHSLLMKTLINEKESAEYISELLKTSSDGKESWEYIRFNGKNLINTITTLELIKREIYLAELEALSVIGSHI